MRVTPFLVCSLHPGVTHCILDSVCVRGHDSLWLSPSVFTEKSTKVTALYYEYYDCIHFSRQLTHFMTINRLKRHCLCAVHKWNYLCMYAKQIKSITACLLHMFMF